MWEDYDCYKMTMLLIYFHTMHDPHIKNQDIKYFVFLISHTHSSLFSNTENGYAS